MKAWYVSEKNPEGAHNPVRLNEQHYIHGSPANGHQQQLRFFIRFSLRSFTTTLSAVNTGKWQNQTLQAHMIPISMAYACSVLL